MAKKRTVDEFSESGKVAAVTGLTVISVTQSTAILRWNKPDGAESVHIERSKDGEKWTDERENTMESVVDSGLSAGTPYHYRAYAVAGGDRSAYSDSITVMTAEAL